MKVFVTRMRGWRVPGKGREDFPTNIDLTITFRIYYLVNHFHRIHNHILLIFALSKVNPLRFDMSSCL